MRCLGPVGQRLGRRLRSAPYRCPAMSQLVQGAEICHREPHPPLGTGCSPRLQVRHPVRRRLDCRSRSALARNYGSDPSVTLTAGNDK